MGEEIANSVSHGVGFLASMVAAPVLIVDAVQRGEVAGVIGASVFSSTVGLLYLASMLYHALPPNRAKRVFRVLDHSAIFLLIAGTYTPFTLGVLHGPWGWSLLVLVWSLGVFDHSAIFLLIAGTYTPFTLGVLHGPWGWSLLVLVWSLALGGVVFKVIFGVRYLGFSVGLYLVHCPESACS